MVFGKRKTPKAQVLDHVGNLTDLANHPLPSLGMMSNGPESLRSANVAGSVAGQNR
jgi:hypothetical protein